MDITIDIGGSGESATLALTVQGGHERANAFVADLVKFANNYRAALDAEAKIPASMKPGPCQGCGDGEYSISSR